MPVDDPFSGGERTIIRPNPGGRLPAAGEPAANRPPGAVPPGEALPGGEPSGARLGGGPGGGPGPPEIGTPTSPAILDISPGINPLVDAAAPILTLVSRLVSILSLDDVEALRRRVRAEFTGFEKRAAAAGLKPEILRACHYALAATVDDVASNMPWGSRNVWADQSMARVFHNDTSGGERFFHLLNHFERDPGAHGDVLELFYLCLSLGFQGRFRILPEGANDLAALRGRLHRLIRQRRGEVAADLSPHWRGIAAPHRSLASMLPLWVLALAVALLLLLIFFGFRLLLGGPSDALFAEVALLPRMVKPQLQAAAVPPPPPPPAPRRIADLLAPDTAGGCVSVQETNQVINVRLCGTGLFQTGSAVLEDSFLPTIDHIAAALKTERGSLDIVGHTDNQPIHTLQFPSNYELSLARAQAVRARIAQTLGAAGNIKVEGFADTRPIADNHTPQGRTMNRRVEIIMLRTSGPP